MANLGHFDVAVIGGGSAGYAAARVSASLGKRVAVVEGGREVGGLCILRGCMPTKALLQASEVAHLVRKASTWGIHATPGPADLSAVMARKDLLIADFAGYRRGQLSDGRFTLLRHSARFVNPREIELDSGDTLSADGFVLATGSVVAPAELPGLVEAGFWTSDDALTAARPPESLIVLGGGAVAVEFAQFFSRMGTEVTVVQRSGQLLKDFDADAATVLQTVFEREGIRLHTETRLLRAGREAQGERWVEFEKEGRVTRVEAEQILFALGRTPATQGLALEKAGVQLQHHRIVTDAQMRTSQPRIFAAGDCTGPYEIVNVAIQQGETAAWNLAHSENPRAIDYRLVSNVVFTEPQIASVGLTEKMARGRGTEILVASYPFSDHGKSMILDAMDGFVKLLADPHSGEILGGCCAGPLGGELIHEIVVAMHQRMTVAALASVPHYHPTLAEIWTYPAEELADKVAAGTGGP